MTPDDYISAARVSLTLETQYFGLWTIHRQDMRNKLPIFRAWAQFDSVTFLSRFTEGTMHTDFGETVMEDSRRELRRHLPIWLRARGRVLITGLGLGCVVRGLLASPHVDHITVVEIDGGILRVIGPEFESNPRVTLIHDDALTIKLDDRFDYAWHDLFTDGPVNLQVLHAKLFKRFHRQCAIQGAWQFPRYFKRTWPTPILQ